MGRYGFGVFLSYRREDAAGYAGRLHEALSRHFYDDDVFIDVAGIEPGDDFVDAINGTLPKCRVLVALMGPRWLDTVSTHGVRRLDDPDDFVRVEIETALNLGTRVIPVLVQGAEMPVEGELPASLAPLCRRQALELSDRLWSESLARLISSIEDSLGRPSPRDRDGMRSDRPAAATFKVLGPLDVRVGDVSIALGGPKQRSLLALLLTEANHVVPTARIIESLWGKDADDAAPNPLRGHVSSLRKALAPAAAALGVEELVRTQRPGYVVRVTGAELDLLAFRELVASAQRVAATNDVRAAADKYREALALVTGDPLADLEDEPFAHPIRSHLRRLVAQANEALLEAEVALGHHREVLSEIEACVAADPMNEHTRGLLMVALYRCGRQAEALATFEDARRVLAAVGVDPSPDLRDVEKRVRAHDPQLSSRPAARPDIELRTILRSSVVVSTAVLVVDEEPPRRIELNRAVTTIGRRAGNDVAFDDPQVSRLHAEIRVNGGDFVIVDGGSTNGTYVNDELVHERSLGSGDEIRIAGHLLRFELLGR